MIYDNMFRNHDNAPKQFGFNYFYLCDQFFHSLFGIEYSVNVVNC